MPSDSQAMLFGSAVASDLSALDQLFHETRAYRSSREYIGLLRFVRRFPAYAPYNCFLLHMQNPGACYVANSRQWRESFQRQVKDGARPMVILVPFGPVGFVYDVADTEGEALPVALTDPFRASGVVPQFRWDLTLSNCKRDLIATVEVDMNTGSAGWIATARPGDSVKVAVGRERGCSVMKSLAARYRLCVNSTYELPARYTTLAHELAHLYCGHLGTPDDKWWPDRRGVPKDAAEFEAESAAYLVCARLGIENPSARYLSSYLRKQNEVPAISLETVLKAVGVIERMGQGHLPPRKYEVADGKTVKV